MNPVDRIAGVVLAAGLSERFGDDSKLLLPFDGSTVVGATIHTAERAGLDPVILVLGHAGDRVRRALTLPADSSVQIVHHRGYRAGKGSSLAAGIRALEATSRPDAVVVLLGDEPGVAREAIDAVVRGWRSMGAMAVRARYLDRPGHPVLLASELFPRLTALEGATGAWTWAARTGISHREIPVAMNAPVDVDTPGDYGAAARSHVTGGGGPQPPLKGR